MSFEELRAYLVRHANIDVDAELARFRQQGGAQDMDAFVAYLRARNLIGSDTLRDLHAMSGIAVGQPVDLRKHRTMAPGPVHSGNTLTLPAGPAPADAATRLDPASARAANLPTLVPAGGDVAAPPAPAPGRSQEHGLDAGGYVMLGQIGAGGMGEVFVARDAELLRKVAYKRLLPQHVGDPTMTAHFFAEAQITAQLDHPNIVPVHEIEVDDQNRLGCSMKLIQGKTLTKLMEQARQAARERTTRTEQAHLDERLEWFVKVCDAMAYAHSKGVLHRDLKPDNIMVGHFQQVYVMDWGICRLMNMSGEEAGAEQERISVTANERYMHGQGQYGAIMGTPGYMSPEQAQGRVPELDRRSDVYALGLILFELVSLRPAVTGDSVETLLYRARQGDRDRLVHFNPRIRISRGLRAIIDKATAPDREQRYASVDALVEDVRALQRNDAIAARPDNVVQRAQRWIGRHKSAALVLIALLLLMGAGATIAMQAVKERQLQAARLHEARMQDFLLTISQHSHELDSHFFDYEQHIARLAGRVKEALARPDTGSETIYASSDFDTPGAGPADLAPAPAYGQPISVAHPVFKLAPDVDAAPLQGQMQRLAGLRPAFEELLVGTAQRDVDARTLDRARLRALVAEEGVPVLRTFVTLQSGVHVSYPGTGGYPLDYDGRLRPKYTLSVNERGMVWGNPFRDRYGHGLILAASTAVHDADGDFIGVTGLEMTFAWIIENLLIMPDAPYIDATYLVDGEGNVVIEALAGAEPAMAAGATEARAGDATSETMTLAPLPHPAVRRALEERRAGHVALEQDGRAKLAAFYHLDALGWSYVVIADEARLLGDAGAGRVAE